MKTALLTCLIVFHIALYAPLARAAGEPDNAAEIELLRQEITRMRADYESRIAELERRLDQTEPALAESAVAAPAATSPATPEPAAPETEYPSSYAMTDAGTDYPASSSTSSGRDNSFNPAIGVTFQGQAWSYSKDPDDYYIPGFPAGGEAGLASEGLSLAETEITMSANVDDKFTAMLNLPVVVENGETGVELEEAWVETTALPVGLAVRAGRMQADVGYLNTKHFHAWDFADQALVYQAFLGGQYIDDGLQLRWLVPADFYMELVGEIMRGDAYPAGGAANSGIGTSTIHLKTGGDVGFSNSWQFGLSWMNADSEDRESGFEDSPLLFTGDTELYMADFVWKWAPNGNSRERNLKFQAEYMWRNENGDYSLPGGATEPWDEDAQGWYAQLIFQPFPRWRIGFRFDSLNGGTSDPAFFNTPLYSLGDDPKRYTIMADWSNSEFSRFRLQYELDQASLQDDHQFALQYIMSIGAHGAHSF